MKLYLALSRSQLVAVLAVTVLIILLAGSFSSAHVAGYSSGATNGERLRFISELNVGEVCEEAEEKTVVIPAEPSDVYEEYNRLQKKAGFDLKRIAGERVTQYSYRLACGTGAVNLLVLNGKIVGGDIADYSLEGIMLPLCRQNNGVKNGKATT